MKKRTLLALALLIPLSSYADVHKCVSNGRTAYQDTPCDQGEVPLAGSGTLSTLQIQVPDTYSLSPSTSQPQSRSSGAAVTALTNPLPNAATPRHVLERVGLWSQLYLNDRPSVYLVNQQALRTVPGD